MPNWFFFLIALLAGAMLPTQSAVNNKLAGIVQSPVLAGFISFAVGTLALLAYMLAAGLPIANLALARQAPPVAWTGGLLGAFYIVVVVTLVPRLGVALTFGLLIAGQMLLTLLIDHYGFLGVPVREISWPRVLGVLLVIAGVVIIRKF